MELNKIELHVLFQFASTWVSKNCCIHSDMQQIPPSPSVAPPALPAVPNIQGTETD